MMLRKMIRKRFVLVSDGKYADGFREWTSDPFDAWTWGTKTGARAHADSFDKTESPGRITVRRRTTWRTFKSPDEKSTDKDPK